MYLGCVLKALVPCPVPDLLNQNPWGQDLDSALLKQIPQVISVNAEV